MEHVSHHRRPNKDNFELFRAGVRTILSDGRYYCDEDINSAIAVGHGHGSGIGRCDSPGLLTFSSDSLYLAWQTSPKIISVIKEQGVGDEGQQQQQQEIDFTIQNSSPVSALRFAPPHDLKSTSSFTSYVGGGGQYVLAVGYEDGTIKLWNAGCAKLITTLLSHSMTITDFCFSVSNGKLLTLSSVSCDGFLKVGLYTDAYIFILTGVPMTLAMSINPLAPWVHSHPKSIASMPWLLNKVTPSDLHSR